MGAGIVTAAFWRKLGWRSLALRVVFPLLAIGLTLGIDLGSAGSGGNKGGGGWLLLLAALGSYALSHLLRALRLTLVAASILPLRVRVLFLLHFHTAAVSLALPFKLGELYRLHELAVLSGDWGRAVMAVVVERAFDAIILLACVALVLTGPTLPADLRIIGVVLTLALGVAVLIFFADPQLAALHGYIFTHHISPQARLALMAICSFRQAIAMARRCVQGNFLLLLLLSAAIWACEAVTLVAVVPALGREAGSFIIDNVTLALTSQGTLLQQPYGLVVAGLLVLFWPVATLFYLHYLEHPRRMDAPSSGDLSLSASLQSRRVRLHVPRRMSCHSS